MQDGNVRMALMELLGDDSCPAKATRTIPSLRILSYSIVHARVNSVHVREWPSFGRSQVSWVAVAVMGEPLVSTAR